MAIQSDAEKFGTIGRMVELAYEMRDLLAAGDLDAFGHSLHKGWELKRSLGMGISHSGIDDIYARARAAGAVGGKLAGAGGGGFLVFYCPEKDQQRLRDALPELKNMEVRFDQAGARIAFAQ